MKINGIIMIFNKMNLKFFSICLLLTYLYTSCSFPSKNVRTVMDAAGDNKAELEKVIEYYKSSGDEEKLKAAYFLIGNMDNKFAWSEETLLKYDPIFMFFKSLREKNMPVSNNSVLVKNTWDSLVTVLGPFNVNETRIIPDFTRIKAKYLIENIDQAFALRDSIPWGHKYSFDQFCEYLLSYRFQHEPLENWRSFYRDKHCRMLDTLKTDSVLQLAGKLHSLIPRVKGHSLFYSYPYDLMIHQMENSRLGNCTQIAIFRAMVLRAAGIPACIDYTLLWGNYHAGHTWNSILLEDGKIFHYEADVPEFGMGESNYKFAKIYRNTFGRQKRNFYGHEEEVPEKIRNYNCIDITEEYTKTADIVVPVKYPLPGSKHFAVICTHNNKTWVPQDWGEIKGKNAIFKNMGTDVLYLAAWYDNGNILPASDPFILKENEEPVFLSPNAEIKQDMHLLRKYPMAKHIRAYHDLAVNNSFQGASRSDFKDSVILHTITSSPEKIETALVSDKHKFRYVRYTSPQRYRSDIAEIELYGGDNPSDTLKLSGIPIGYPETLSSFGTPYKNAFDGNIETYFSVYFSRRPGWTGLDLGKPKFITKIKYCPRSDTNFIVEGDRYELCYWNKDEWISMGEQKETKPSLDYQDVPSGGLYILNNLSRGKEERVFTWEEGKQVFW